GAVVADDIRRTILDLHDGRVLNGIIAANTVRSLTIRAMTETLTVVRGVIAGIRESSVSLMPEGLLEGMTPEQARDLIAYLMHDRQAFETSHPVKQPSILRDTLRRHSAEAGSGGSVR